METPYDEAAAADNPLRAARSKFWNGKSGEAALSEDSEPNAFDYPLTHKHAASVEGLREGAAVIVGNVREARSFLSGDKSVIYTEMQVTGKDVLQDRSGSSLAAGSVISVTRAGGVVRLPSGKVLTRGCVEESIPRQGRAYLLVLDYAKAEDMFPVRTGFELSGDHVYMLDIVQRNSLPRLYGRPGVREVLTLAEYGLPSGDFIEIVQNALARSANQ
jgi:hypothetical protein